jgi:hypothetical protein
MTLSSGSSGNIALIMWIWVWWRQCCFIAWYPLLLVSGCEVVAALKVLDVVEDKLGREVVRNLH